ncbi:MAG: hypothetical protein AB7E73_12555 [Burkholderiales bacterium]
MFRQLLSLRRILAILLLATLTLVQVKVAFAGCMAADGSAPQIAAMEDCEGCNSDKGESYEVLSRICSTHCLQGYVSTENVPERPVLAAPALSVAGTAAPPSAIPPPRHNSSPGKTRLIYHLQRLLI